jgi:LysR family cyn operon transcriptional activator
MELRQLRYFLTVAEERHFRRAAERLSLTGPALSQQIRQLELELDVQLFDRLGRAVRLTSTGEVFLAHARRVLRDVEDARVALDDLRTLRRGSLRIGVVQTVNEVVLPQVIARYTTAYPGMQVTVEERSADTIEAGLLDGTLQLGIGFTPPAQSAIEAEPLFSEELILVVRDDHRLARCGAVGVAELAAVPLAVFPGGFCTRRLWDACALAAGIAPAVQVEVNTIAGLLAVVRASALATVLPALALRGVGVERLVGVRLYAPTPRRTVGLLWRRHAYRCAATQAFAEIARLVIATEAEALAR